MWMPLISQPIESSSLSAEINKEQQFQVQKLLSSFDKVFGEVTSLPLNRPTAYVIPLVLGVIAVNVHPYRYGHFEKNEIEKLVGEMLTAGIKTQYQSLLESSSLG
uniref:Uncharacterized protein n=1 Tax=Manihot esculenta TaxID=3983 RepID=A0A2C9UID2_MANES